MATRYDKLGTNYVAFELWLHVNESLERGSPLTGWQSANDRALGPLARIRLLGYNGLIGALTCAS